MRLPGMGRAFYSAFRFILVFFFLLPLAGRVFRFRFTGKNGYWQYACIAWVGATPAASTFPFYAGIGPAYCVAAA